MQQLAPGPRYFWQQIPDITHPSQPPVCGPHLVPSTPHPCCKTARFASQVSHRANNDHCPLRGTILELARPICMGLPPLPVGLAVTRNQPKRPYGRHWSEEGTILTYDKPRPGQKGTKETQFAPACAPSSYLQGKGGGQ